MDANQEFLTEEQRKKGWTLSTGGGQVILKFRGYNVLVQRNMGNGPPPAKFLTKDKVQYQITDYQKKYQRLIEVVDKVTTEKIDSYHAGMGEVVSVAQGMGFKDLADFFNQLEKERFEMWKRASNKFADLNKNRP
jgi:uncharacterized protein (DUF362 family)